MSSPTRKEWVVPVLRDIQTFLKENGMPEMAQDIQALLVKHAEPAPGTGLKRPRGTETKAQSSGVRLI